MAHKCGDRNGQVPLKGKNHDIYFFEIKALQNPCQIIRTTCFHASFLAGLCKE